ncbi:hypothetical protein XENOCAPTIV_007771, partial [Xenoophorus captivus]
MKRKRVGAGQRGSSNCFLSAKDLLNPSTSDAVSSNVTENGGFFRDSSEGPGDKRIRVKETNTETMSAPTSSIRARASAVSAHLNSPTKGSRAMSRKQQKLADAAKSSRNISQYFVKTKPVEEESCEEAELPMEAAGFLSETLCEIYEESIRQELHSLAAVDVTASDPALLETEDLVLIEPKSEVIVLSDDEEADKERTLTLVEDTPHEDKTTLTAYSNLSKHFYKSLLAKARSLPLPGEPVTLKEAANIVVHYLDPYYSQGKFATK